MTRCKEFYEKIERDGNFCKMPRRSYEDAVKYWKEYRAEAEEVGENSPIPEDKWIRDQREQSKAIKKLEAVEKAGALPEGKFNVIYADPPWDYEMSEVEGAASHKYSTMTVDEIQELKPQGKILFLWATNPLIPEAFEVMKGWGFTYKAMLTWVKPKPIGMGWWLKSQSEQLIIGVNGKTQPPTFVPPSVFEAPRKKHSEKPTAVYTLIENMYPNGSYLEMFARKKHSEKWEVWGNEV